MASRRIRISSRALGPKYRVIVRVYDTVDEMCEAGRRFNGNDLSGSGGITQGYITADGGFVPVIRLARGYLSNVIVSHEMHHAATGIYGSAVRGEPDGEHLVHVNEPFAHLYSDLYVALVNALYAHGYYGERVA